ncbi:MAG: GNAT family N-acetyltransferase [Chloroflexaceae bacterium]|nr:GNAT family N-acetyltransferase [Chloroflexaceae bacterium]
MLSEIPANDIIVHYFAEEMKKNGFLVTRDESRSFYHIDLTGNYEVYYKNYVHKKTLDLRTRINKLKREKGDYSVVQIQNNLLEYWKKMLEQYRVRRATTGQPNAFDDKRLNKMLHRIIPQYEARGWLQMSILKGPDGEDWAYQFDFVKDGVQYHYAPSFNMKYAAYSPSKILLLETIKAGFANPNLIEFNFMRGESEYKNNLHLKKQAIST